MCLCVFECGCVPVSVIVFVCFLCVYVGDVCICVPFTMHLFDHCVRVCVCVRARVFACLLHPRGGPNKRIPAVGCGCVCT